MKILLIILFLLFPFLTLASDITLEWDPNTEPDIDEYRIYQSQTSGQYLDPPIAIVKHPITECAIGDLPDGIYYWTATAADISGNESARSNEVNHIFYQGSPIAPGDLRKKFIYEIPVQ